MGGDRWSYHPLRSIPANPQCRLGEWTGIGQCSLKLFGGKQVAADYRMTGRGRRSRWMGGVSVKKGGWEILKEETP